MQKTTERQTDSNIGPQGTKRYQQDSALRHPYPFGTFSVLRVRTEEIDDARSRFAAASPRI
jgi:hypothetical protein